MAKISIYTRAYNTEKYIEQCITSILNQTFSDFEYIIVDNGSTDRTKDIIQKYAQLDKRIKRIRLEKNRTNVLLDILAHGIDGKYFATLDSDDWYEPDFLENLYYFAQNNELDIAVCGSKFHVMSNGNIAYRRSNERLILDKNSFADYFRFYYQFFRTIWAKLFKTEIIMKSNFDSLLKNGEGAGHGSDTLFSMSVLIMSKKIGISDKVLHNYRVHDKSASYVYNEKRINSDILLFKGSEEFLSTYGEISSKNYHFIYLVYLNAIKETINILLKLSFKIPWTINELNNILKQPLTQKMFEYMKGDKNLKSFKKDLINVIIKLGQAEINNPTVEKLIYSNICLLFEGIEDYLYEYEIQRHLKNPGYMLYMSGIDKKSLFKDNILLEWIKDENFIFEYHEIINDVYFKDLYEGLDKTIALLTEDNEIKFKEELIFMCLNLAATLEEGGIFVYAKKLQWGLFMDEDRFEEAEGVLKDLTDMCPDDQEVLKMSKYMEESYE